MVVVPYAAIREAPAPTCVKELGLVNYYGRFLPNQSIVAVPLYRLLRDNVPWKQSEQRAFEKCKDLLTNNRVMVHYDLPLTLACDLSAYGIGAVFQHTMTTGEEHSTENSRW